MIRKIAIVVLTLAAVGTGAISALSPPTNADGILLDSPYQWLVRRPPYVVLVSVAGGHARLVVGHADADRVPFYRTDFSRIIRYRGFYSMTSDFSMGLRTWWLGFPLWAAFALFAFYPALAFIRGPLRRHRRRKRRLCLKCGYNLAGNVSGVCPECGSAVSDPSC